MASRKQYHKLRSRITCLGILPQIRLQRSHSTRFRHRSNRTYRKMDTECRPSHKNPNVRSNRLAECINIRLCNGIRSPKTKKLLYVIRRPGRKTRRPVQMKSQTEIQKASRADCMTVKLQACEPFSLRAFYPILFTASMPSIADDTIPPA